MSPRDLMHSIVNIDNIFFFWLLLPAVISEKNAIFLKKGKTTFHYGFFNQQQSTLCLLKPLTKKESIFRNSNLKYNTELIPSFFENFFYLRHPILFNKIKKEYKAETENMEISATTRIIYFFINYILVYFIAPKTATTGCSAGTTAN